MKAIGEIARRRGIEIGLVFQNVHPVPEKIHGIPTNIHPEEMVEQVFMHLNGHLAGDKPLQYRAYGRDWRSVTVDEASEQITDYVSSAIVRNLSREGCFGLDSLTIAEHRGLQVPTLGKRVNWLLDIAVHEGVRFGTGSAIHESGSRWGQTQVQGKLFQNTGHFLLRELNQS